MEYDANDAFGRGRSLDNIGNSRAIGYCPMASTNDWPGGTRPWERAVRPMLGVRGQQILGVIRLMAGFFNPSPNIPRRRWALNGLQIQTDCPALGARMGFLANLIISRIRR